MKPPTLHLTTVKATSLSEDDKKLLADLEAQIENSRMNFCVALAEIRDHKDGIFWKETHGSFQEYVRTRFGYGEQHTSRLVATGGFLLALGNAHSSAPKPIRENQVRPIINKLPKNHHVPCWELITQTNAPDKLTGETVKAGVVEYRKTIPTAELQTSKPDRKPKKTALENQIKSKSASLALIKRLKLATEHLPNANEIHRSLESLISMISKDNYFTSSK